MPTTNYARYTGLKLEPALLAGGVLPAQLPALFQANQTIARGTLVGELVASPGTYAGYDHAQSDGRQVLKGITVYDVTTDANGKITNLSGAIYGLDENAPIFINGTFRCEDISNNSELDDAIAAGFCKLKQGTSTTGIFTLL